MSAMLSSYQQTKNEKTEYVCHVHIMLADKIDKNQEMSAMYSFCRRTKPRKSQICLPALLSL